MKCLNYTPSEETGSVHDATRVELEYVLRTLLLSVELMWANMNNMCLMRVVT